MGGRDARRTMQAHGTGIPTTADCPSQPQQQQAGWPGSEAQQSATLILQPRNTMQGVVLQGRRCTPGAANVHKEARQVAP